VDLKQIIRTIPDFPEPGVMFRDISTVLQDPAALKHAVDQMANLCRGHDFDLVLGPESRGFIFGVPVAYILNKGFVPIRKAGKLPYKTVRKSYALEYGESVLEMHVDAVKPGQRVIIVDDLLATGGTSRAMAEMIEEIGGKVIRLAFFIELEMLGGRGLLNGYDVESVIKY